MLAEKIHNNSGKGVIPTPITMEELEEMLMEFGIMKTEEQALAALACHDGGVHVDRARVGVVTPDERHGEGVVVDREVEQAAGGDSHPSSLGTAHPQVSRSGR